MARRRITFIVLIVALAPFQLVSQTQREPRILLHETFDQNDGQWKEQQDTWINLAYRDGKYRMSARDTLQQPVVRDVGLPRTGDFDIECTVEARAAVQGQPFGNEPFGLVFGYQRPTYFFEYLVWTDGRVGLHRNASVEREDLVDTRSANLNTGFATNTLKLSRRGQTLLYYLNGKKEGEVPFTHEIGPRVGFVIWGGIEVYFDDLVVTVP